MPHRAPDPAAWTWAAVVCAAFLGVPAPGAQAEDYARNGWFGRAGYAVGFDDTSVIGDAASLVGATSNVGTNHGFDLGAGYRAHPNLAFEVQFEWLAASDITLSNPVLPSPSGTVGSLGFWSSTVNLKNYLLTGRIQPFALLGIGGGMADVSLNSPVAGLGSSSFDVGGFVARFGGGVEGYVTERFALFANGSYLLTAGDLDGNNYGTVSVGLIYRH